MGMIQSGFQAILKSKIAIIATIGIVIIATLYVANTAIETGGEVIEATINLLVENADTGDQFSGSIDVEEGDTLSTLAFWDDKSVTLQPLTTYQAEVPQLDPNGNYILTWSVSIKVTPKDPIKAGSVVTETLKMTGRNTYQDIDYAYYKQWEDNIGGVENEARNSIINKTITVPEAERNATITQTEGFNLFVRENNQNYRFPILGSYIDGSTFSFDITVNAVKENDLPMFGQLTGDIELSIGEGDIIIEVTDIGVNSG